MTSPPARSCARLFSIFVYPLIIAIITGSCFMANPAKKANIPVNPDAEPFDATKDPIWITHLTDLHISPNYPDSADRMNKTLIYIKEKIDPTFVLLSGDLADNYKRIDPPSASHPMEEHWKLYRSIVAYSNFPDEQVFEVFGNHDLWGIYEYDGTKEPSTIYTPQMPHDNMYGFTKIRHGLRMIAFNPLDFPTGHGGQLFVPPLTKPQMDFLEEKINEKHDNAEYTIVSTHYTNELLFPKSKSSTSKSYKDLLSQQGDNRVLAVLNGHTHPAKLETSHYGKCIEFTLTDFKTKDEFGLMTIDNGRIHYRVSYRTVEKPAIVTYPTPDYIATEISPHGVFNIRVISYSDLATNFKVTSDTGFKCTLAFERNVRNAKMYSCPANFPKGKHSIHVTGDLDETIEFSVDQNAGPFYENHKIDFISFSMVVGVVLLFVYHTIIIVFLYIPSSIIPFINEVENWIRTGDGIVNWVVPILAGPALVGFRLKAIPLWFKIILTVMVYWPICLPVVIYKTQGHVSMLWLYGFVVKSEVAKDIFSLIFVVIFMITFLFILEWMLALYSYKFNYSFIVDFIVSIILAIAAEYFYYMYGGDVGNDGYWSTSFLFFLLPIVLIVLVIVLYTVIHPKENAQVESEREKSDTSNSHVEVSPEAEIKDTINV